MRTDVGKTGLDRAANRLLAVVLAIPLGVLLQCFGWYGFLRGVRWYEPVVGMAFVAFGAFLLMGAVSLIENNREPW